MSIHTEANCLQPLLQNDVSNNCLPAEMQAFIDTTVKISMSALLTPLLGYYLTSQWGFAITLYAIMQSKQTDKS